MRFCLTSKLIPATIILPNRPLRSVILWIKRKKKRKWRKKRKDDKNVRKYTTHVSRFGESMSIHTNCRRIRCENRKRVVPINTSVETNQSHRRIAINGLSKGSFLLHLACFFMNRSFHPFIFIAAHILSHTDTICFRSPSLIVNVSCSYCYCCMAVTISFVSIYIIRIIHILIVVFVETVSLCR